MKRNFNGSVLRSYSTALGTAGERQRISTRVSLDCGHADLPGFHFGQDGCLDAPEEMPAGSTVAKFKPGFVCDAGPSSFGRA